MTYEVAHNAIRTRFAERWAALAPLVPVAWPNVTFRPPADGSWARFVIADADALQASFGSPDSNVHRHAGLVTVMLFTPLNVGDATALRLVDIATGIFRGWRDNASGVLFRRPPYARQIGSEERWHHVNVLCPFERDSLL